MRQRMNHLAEFVRATKESGDFSGLVANIPYLRFLGFTATVEGGDIIGKMSYADGLIGNASIPALHGGTIGALMESTALLHALYQSETLVLPKIVSITVDFLRTGRPVDTFARGTITKRGRRVVNVGVQAWQEDAARPISRANCIFLVEGL
jgi:acyl-coenzyme A thioesterase PaaI-like protein